MDAIIKNYQNNIDQINALYEKQKKINNDHDKKAWDIKDKYREQISKIEDKRYSELFVIEKKKNKEIEEIEAQKKIVSEEISKVRKLLEFTNLYVQGMVVEKPVVYSYDSYREKQTIEPVRLIREDKYCIIHLYIIPNEKPVNKFSLIAVGCCPILEPTRETINPLHSYGIRAHTENHMTAHIMYGVKDSYSEEDLMEYIEKNIKRIMKLFSVIDEIIPTYEKAVELFEHDEWKIIYYNDRKDYYENRYCNGTATPEYKAVLKKLKKLGV